MHSVALGVIDSARGRQRRRVSIVAMLAIFAAAFGIGVSRSGNLSTSRAPTLHVPSRVTPAAVFSQAPDMGVACLTRACDSVGLAVWLRRPAASVNATVAGHPLKLTTRAALPYQPAPARAHRMFVGYLTALRLITRMRLVLVQIAARWPGPTDPVALVSLRITYRNGRVVMTRLRVPVQPGWG